MVQARGRSSHLLLDFEDSFGTTPATPTAIKMPFNSSQVRSSQTLNEDETITSSRNPAMPTRGNIDVSGQIVVPVDVTGIGYWLKAMFGATTPSGDTTYTHVFKPGDDQPSLTLEQGFTDIGVYELFNGCKISRFGITVGGEGAVNATIDVMGSKETIGAASFDTEPTEITLDKFSQFQASIKEGGTDLGIATEVEMQIDFGLDGDQYVIGGEGVRGDIPEGIIQISGRVRALFESKTLLEKAINGTESSLKLTFTSGTNSLEFYLPEILYERNSPGIEGSRGVLIELPYRAFYGDNADKTAIKVTLINGHALY